MLPSQLLVPVDGSENANQAAAHAGVLADELGVSVRLLYAFSDSAVEMFGVLPESMGTEALGYMTPETFETLRRDNAQAVFRAARGMMRGCQAFVDEQLLVGEPAQVIVAEAEATTGCWLVMGRRGLSRFKEVVLGSTTQHVLHHAACPILVIR